MGFVMRHYPWLIGIVALAASCTPAPPTLEVCDGGASTITRTTVQSFPNTTIEIDHGGDPALIGKKEVRVNVTARQDIVLRSVLLTYWRAGHNVASQTIEQTLSQSMSPGTNQIFIKQVPDSESLQICEGLYYMWTVSYQKTDGPNGVFIGQPKLVLVTQQRLPNGTIEQALCPAPPGPDA
jgi:hypothetical protein